MKFLKTDPSIYEKPAFSDPTPNPIVEKTRATESYDYATSGIDYTLGTEHHVGGTHYVKCTDEELAKWNV